MGLKEGERPCQLAKKPPVASTSLGTKKEKKTCVWGAGSRRFSIRCFFFFFLASVSHREAFLPAGDPLRNILPFQDVAHTSHFKIRRV